MSVKLGPHVILPSAPALRWEAGAPVVKGLDDTAVFSKVPSNAIRVFRHYFATQSLQNPQGVANTIINALNDYDHSNLYVEVYNEAYQSSAEIQDYCDFLTQVITYLHAANLKVAAFSFSTGNPDYPVWSYIRSRRFCGADAVAIHEYWGDQGFTLQNALRHRTLWQVGDPKILITECGRDAVEGGKAGWKISNITQDEYINELVAYDLQIQQDSYILGATPFTAGPTPDWQNFSTDEISDALMQKLAAANGGNGGNVATDPTIVDLQNRVAALESRDGLLVKCIEAILESKINGATGVLGYLTALNGGTTPSLNVVWPPSSPK